MAETLYRNPQGIGRQQSSRNEKRNEMDAESELSIYSSSSSSTYLDISREYPITPKKGRIRTFFTAPSERRRLRKTRSRRILSLGNSSSSSVNTDLAYGTGFLRVKKSRIRKSRSRRDKEKRRSSNPDAAIAAIGVGLATAARRQNVEDLRSSRRTEIFNNTERRSRNSNEIGPGIRSPQNLRGHDQILVEEEDWESASEDESVASSYADSTLAFGDVYVSPPRNKSSVVDPRLFGPANSLRGYVTEPVGFGHVDPNTVGVLSPPQFYSERREDRRYDERRSTEREYAPSSVSSRKPLQTVFPMPTSDPTRFEATRGSVVSAEEPLVVRPRPVPLQQPQPITPVSQVIYNQASEVNAPSDRRSSSYGKSIAGAALAGMAGAAIGSMIAKDRSDDKRLGSESDREDRRKAKGKGKDRADRRSKRSDRDEATGEKSSKRGNRDSTNDRGEKRREKRVESPPDERQEKRRDKRGDSEREEGADERRARRREERRAERSRIGEYDVGRDSGVVESSIAREPIDPFQFQVAEDAFQTPDISREIEAAESRRGRDPSPTVYTVEREPDFSRMRDQVYDVPYDVEPIRRDEHSADAAVSTAFAAQVAAVAAAGGFRGTRSERRRAERRGSRTYYERRGESENGEDEQDRIIQEDADRAYRESVIARKAASRVIRERSPSPDAVDKYRRSGRDDAEEVRILTPPGMEGKKSSGPYDAPNADFELDRIMDPTEFKTFSVPQLTMGSPVIDSYQSPIRTNYDPSRFDAAPGRRPLLTLVRPTPTPSPNPFKQASSPKRVESPPPSEERRKQRSRSQSVDDFVIDNKGNAREIETPTASAFSKAVTWGPNETKHYDIESPGSIREEFMSSPAGDMSKTAPSESRKKSSGWGVVAGALMGAAAGIAGSESPSSPQSRQNKGKEQREYRSIAAQPDESEGWGPQTPPATGPKPTDKSMPGSFADDIDFTATLAAGLQDSGFDPNIVIDDPTYRKRMSPPGSDEDFGSPYQKPFAETITDLGDVPRRAAKEDSDRRAYGEIDRIQDTQLDNDPPRNEDLSSKLSKKEQKRRDKKSRQQSVDKIDDRAAEESPASRSIVAEPESYAESTKPSKRDQKKRDKGTKRQDSGPADHANPAEEIQPNREVVAEPESYFEPAKKSKRKSKRSSLINEDEEQISRHEENYQKVSVPIDAFDDIINTHAGTPGTTNEWDSPVEERKEKSKRSSSRYDSPSKDIPRNGRQYETAPDPAGFPLPMSTISDPEPADFPLPASTASDVSRAGYVDERFQSKSFRDSGIFDPSDREIRSIVTTGADNEDSRKSKKKSRSSRRGDDDDDTKSVASAPAYDDYESSKKGKKKSRSSSKYDDEDTRSVASAPTYDPEDGKKSKKNGFFGLFGISSGKSDSGKSRDESPKAAASDGEDSKKKRKSKRSSLADSSELYGNVRAESVIDSPRADSTHRGQDDDNDDRRSGRRRHRSKEEKRKSTQDDKDSFLASAGTLGAGVGLAGAAVAYAANHLQSEATNTNPNGTDLTSDRSSATSEAKFDDPEISHRPFRPSIDPQYGDLLPLPPSEPPSPCDGPGAEDLPQLPDSRPDTPESERRIAREKQTLSARKVENTPLKSPSQSAVPLRFVLKDRSTPTSPDENRSFAGLPFGTSSDMARSRNRPTSWDSTKEFKPLYLVEHNRHGSAGGQTALDDPHPSTKQAEHEGIPFSEREAADSRSLGHTDPEFSSESTAINTNDVGSSEDQKDAKRGQIGMSSKNPPVFAEPSPIEATSKTRSSYLLQDTPPLQKHNSRSTDEGSPTPKQKKEESLEISAARDKALDALVGSHSDNVEVFATQQFSTADDALQQIPVGRGLDADPKVASLTQHPEGVLSHTQTSPVPLEQEFSTEPPYLGLTGPEVVGEDASTTTKKGKKNKKKNRTSIAGPSTPVESLMTDFDSQPVIDGTADLNTEVDSYAAGPDNRTEGQPLVIPDEPSQLSSKSKKTKKQQKRAAAFLQAEENIDTSFQAVTHQDAPAKELTKSSDLPLDDSLNEKPSVNSNEVQGSTLKTETANQSSSTDPVSASKREAGGVGSAADYEEDQLTLARQLPEEFGLGSSKKSKKGKKKRQSGFQTPDISTPLREDPSFFDDTQVRGRGLEDSKSPGDSNLSDALQADFGSESKESEKDKRKNISTSRPVDDKINPEPAEEQMHIEQSTGVSSTDLIPGDELSKGDVLNAGYKDDSFGFGSKKKKDKKRRSAPQTTTQENEPRTLILSESQPTLDSREAELDAALTQPLPTTPSGDRFASGYNEDQLASAEELGEEFDAKSKPSKKDKKRQSLPRSATIDESNPVSFDEASQKSDPFIQAAETSDLADSVIDTIPNLEPDISPDAAVVEPTGASSLSTKSKKAQKKRKSQLQSGATSSIQDEMGNDYLNDSADIAAEREILSDPATDLTKEITPEESQVNRGISQSQPDDIHTSQSTMQSIEKTPEQIPLPVETPNNGETELPSSSAELSLAAENDTTAQSTDPVLVDPVEEFSPITKKSKKDKKKRKSQLQSPVGEESFPGVNNNAAQSLKPDSHGDSEDPSVRDAELRKFEDDINSKPTDSPRFESPTYGASENAILTPAEIQPSEDTNFKAPLVLEELSLQPQTGDLQVKSDGSKVAETNLNAAETSSWDSTGLRFEGETTLIGVQDSEVKKLEDDLNLNVEKAKQGGQQSTTRRPSGDDIDLAVIGPEEVIHDESLPSTNVALQSGDLREDLKSNDQNTGSTSKSKKAKKKDKKKGKASQMQESSLEETVPPTETDQQGSKGIENDNSKETLSSVPEELAISEEVKSVEESVQDVSLPVTSQTMELSHTELSHAELPSTILPSESQIQDNTPVSDSLQSTQKTVPEEDVGFTSKKLKKDKKKRRSQDLDRELAAITPTDVDASVTPIEDPNDSTPLKTQPDPHSSSDRDLDRAVENGDSSCVIPERGSFTEASYFPEASSQPESTPLPESRLQPESSSLSEPNYQSGPTSPLDPSTTLTTTTTEPTPTPMTEVNDQLSQTTLGANEYEESVSKDLKPQFGNPEDKIISMSESKKDKERQEDLDVTGDGNATVPSTPAELATDLNQNQETLEITPVVEALEDASFATTGKKSKRDKKKKRASVAFEGLDSQTPTGPSNPTETRQEEQYRGEDDVSLEPVVKPASTEQPISGPIEDDSGFSISKKSKKDKKKKRASITVDQQSDNGTSSLPPPELRTEPSQIEGTQTFTEPTRDTINQPVLESLRETPSLSIETEAKSLDPNPLPETGTDRSTTLFESGNDDTVAILPIEQPYDTVSSQPDVKSLDSGSSTPTTAKNSKKDKKKKRASVVLDFQENVNAASTSTPAEPMNGLENLQVQPSAEFSNVVSIPDVGEESVEASGIEDTQKHLTSESPKEGVPLDTVSSSKDIQNLPIEKPSKDDSIPVTISRAMEASNSEHTQDLPDLDPQSEAQVHGPAKESSLPEKSPISFVEELTKESFPSRVELTTLDTLLNESAEEPIETHSSKLDDLLSQMPEAQGSDLPDPTAPSKLDDLLSRSVEPSNDNLLTPEPVVELSKSADALDESIVAPANDTMPSPGKKTRKEKKRKGGLNQQSDADTTDTSTPVEQEPSNLVDVQNQEMAEVPKELSLDPGDPQNIQDLSSQHDTVPLEEEFGLPATKKSKKDKKKRKGGLDQLGGAGPSEASTPAEPGLDTNLQYSSMRGEVGEQSFDDPHQQEKFLSSEPQEPSIDNTLEKGHSMPSDESVEKASDNTFQEDRAVPSGPRETASDNSFQENTMPDQSITEIVTPMEDISSFATGKRSKIDGKKRKSGLGQQDGLESSDASTPLELAPETTLSKELEPSTASDFTSKPSKLTEAKASSPPVEEIEPTLPKELSPPASDDSPAAIVVPEEYISPQPFEEKEFESSPSKKSKKDKKKRKSGLNQQASADNTGASTPAEQEFDVKAQDSTLPGEAGETVMPVEEEGFGYNTSKKSKKDKKNRKSALGLSNDASIPSSPITAEHILEPEPRIDSNPPPSDSQANSLVFTEKKIALDETGQTGALRLDDNATALSQSQADFPAAPYHENLPLQSSTFTTEPSTITEPTVTTNPDQPMSSQTTIDPEPELLSNLTNLEVEDEDHTPIPEQISSPKPAMEPVPELTTRPILEPEGKDSAENEWAPIPSKKSKKDKKKRKGTIDSSEPATPVETYTPVLEENEQSKEISFDTTDPGAGDPKDDFGISAGKKSKKDKKKQKPSEISGDPEPSGTQVLVVESDSKLDQIIPGASKPSDGDHVGLPSYEDNAALLVSAEDSSQPMEENWGVTGGKKSKKDKKKGKASRFSGETSGTSTPIIIDDQIQDPIGKNEELERSTGQHGTEQSIKPDEEWSARASKKSKKDKKRKGLSSQEQTVSMMTAPLEPVLSDEITSEISPNVEPSLLQDTSINPNLVEELPQINPSAESDLIANNPGDGGTVNNHGDGGIVTNQKSEMDRRMEDSLDRNRTDEPTDTLNPDQLVLSESTTAIEPVPMDLQGNTTTLETQLEPRQRLSRGVSTETNPASNVPTPEIGDVTNSNATRELDVIVPRNAEPDEQPITLPAEQPVLDNAEDSSASTRKLSKKDKNKRKSLLSAETSTPDDMTSNLNERSPGKDLQISTGTSDSPKESPGTSSDFSNLSRETSKKSKKRGKSEVDSAAAKVICDEMAASSREPVKDGSPPPMLEDINAPPLKRGHFELDAEPDLATPDAESVNPLLRAKFHGDKLGGIPESSASSNDKVDDASNKLSNAAKIGVGAGLGVVAGLAAKFGGPVSDTKKSKKGKKKIVDRRSTHEDDLFDDPALWEGADKPAHIEPTTVIEAATDDDFWTSPAEAMTREVPMEHTSPMPRSEHNSTEKPLIKDNEKKQSFSGQVEQTSELGDLKIPKRRDRNKNLESGLPDTQTKDPVQSTSLSNLSPVVEESSPQVPSDKKDRQMPALDPNRDSTLVDESPVPPQRGFEHQYIRDSGVQLRDWSPSSAERKPEAVADQALKRLSWPRVNEDTETIDLARPREPSIKAELDKHIDDIALGVAAATASRKSSPVRDRLHTREHLHRTPSPRSLGILEAPNRSHSPKSLGDIPRLHTPDQSRAPSAASVGSIGSNFSSATPPLRRTHLQKSGDLRSLSQRSEASSVKQAELSDPIEISKAQLQTPGGQVHVKDMADVYDGYGEGRIGSPISPTRPPSMRRRQSMKVLDLEAQLHQLAEENRMLSEGKTQAEQSLYTAQRAVATLADRDAEIDSLKQTIDWLHREVSRLTEVNEGLTSANVTMGNQHNERYNNLELQHNQTSRELEDIRQSYANVSGGMEGVEYQNTLEEKNREIAQLYAELEVAKEQIRVLQRQILAAKANDSEFLTVRDEDYFDSACQKLCGYVQQWVLRFSKFSDMRACRLTSEISNEKIVNRLDNAVLDGSEVDQYLADRVKRRDIFMSMTMMMVWEFVFTRYLFGMDREQRQKLKSLEKLLAEVGPQPAVHQWRAITLTLLSKREAFLRQREQDTEAVVQEIFSTLSEILPPPSQLEDQIQDQLRKVMKAAVDLSIDMRTQRAEYMMLPPLLPEYDANGDLAHKFPFNAALMNERSGDTTSNEELEQQGAVVRVVLFPLVVKKGDDGGEGDEEIVVCPAQVLVAKEHKRRSSGRLASGGHSGIMGGANASRLSMQSSMPGHSVVSRDGSPF